MDRTSLELLLEREMPFGKHKGCVLADLPGNYLNWFAREGFPPGVTHRPGVAIGETDSSILTSTPHRRIIDDAPGTADPR